MRITRWDQRLDTKATNAIVLHLCIWHISQITEVCEQVVKIRNAIGAEDTGFLCACELEYGELSANTAYHLRQVLGFFSKRSDLDLGVDRTEVAGLKFLESEELCWRTNELFKARAAGQLALPPAVEATLWVAQRKIARILGELPRFSDLEPTFGPGATTQVEKRNASPRAKLGQAFACSEELIPVASAALGELQQWIPFGDSDAVIVPLEIHPGRVAFVPKNAKTDRTIVVEPMLNSMYQLAIGKVIARRLRRFGQNIKDQSENQRLAREGSLTGALATLDLSSASDTIAKELVFDLLPVDWAHFLSYFRTSKVEFGNGHLRLQKFSSMGNGYTFPLETLIFYGLAKAATEQSGCQGAVRVYGDDIIVPVGAYNHLCEVLRVCGFIPNHKKSFSSGPFRESCGKDYLSGFDIRPFYLKGTLGGEELFKLHNFYVRKGMDEPAKIVVSFLDPYVRLYGPDGFGDGHLVSDLWKGRPHNRESGWGGYTFDTYTHKSRRSYMAYSGDHVLPSYTVYASPSQDDAGPTSSFLRTRIGRPGRSGTFHPQGGTPVVYDKKGGLGVTTPGTEGYKRISIYYLG